MMTRIASTQLPQRYRDIVEEQIAIYSGRRVVEQRNSIPDTTDIPIEDPQKWLKIPDVICVYVDMLGSTKLSAVTHDSQTAGAYQLFTGCAVKLFAGFEAPYIDVRGDGAFALFDSNQQYRALAAAVTFKTFARVDFVPLVRAASGVDVGTHIGIDCSTVLVRKLGFKRYRGRSDRQNEVWAGKPVNMAAKLASATADNELLVSDRFFQRITDSRARISCGCEDDAPSRSKKPLWEEIDVRANPLFDFSSAYRLRSYWCKWHGSEYCSSILALSV
jgi:class 3 adenylate cyclase